MLIHLFGSDARVKILALFTLHAGTEYYLREIAQETGLGVRSVQRVVAGLVEIHVLERRKRGNSVYFRLNDKNPIVADLKAIFLKTVGLGNFLRDSLASQQEIEVAFIYGSVAKGEETVESDLDLAIIGTISSQAVSKILSEAEKRLGREINATVFTPREWAGRLASDDHFVTTLLREAKIVLIGHDLELRQVGRE